MNSKLKNLAKELSEYGHYREASEVYALIKEAVDQDALEGLGEEALGPAVEELPITMGQYINEIQPAMEAWVKQQIKVQTGKG